MSWGIIKNFGETSKTPSIPPFMKKGRRDRMPHSELSKHLGSIDKSPKFPVLLGFKIIGLEWVKTRTRTEKGGRGKCREERGRERNELKSCRYCVIRLLQTNRTNGM